jgi:FkbM family methyltransferase
MNAFRAVAHRTKRLARVCAGRDVYIRRDIRRNYEVLGNDGAAFAIMPDLLTPESKVYSFGIGTDISFDLALIRRFGLELHAFDPTPRSLEWLAFQSVPAGFHAHEYGVADVDGEIRFVEPKCPAHVSYTSVARHGLTQTVTAPVHRLGHIMQELGHTHLDLLKLDIEGAEYGVIRDMLANRIRVRQLCVEFHHRWPEIGPTSTKKAVESLGAAGYKSFHISASGEEYSFLAH